MTLVVSSTQRILDSNEWLKHTHVVLDELTQDSELIERIAFRMQLFQATHQEDNYRTVLTMTDALNTGALRLQDLVRDNSAQLQRSRDLLMAVERLSRAVDADKGSEAIPETQLRDLRQIVREMQATEHSLLEQRRIDTHQWVWRPMLWGTADLGFSMLVWVILFSILIRDAARRRQFQERLSRANGSLATTVEALGARVGEAMLLKNARDELQLCVTAQEAYACSARHLNQLVPGSSGVISIINNSRSMLITSATWGDEEGMLDGFEAEACCGLRTGRPRWRKVGESEIHCSHFVGLPPENYMCIPLAALGETLGFAYLNLLSESVQTVAVGREALINEMVELAAMAIAGLNLRAKLENQSIRDGLTNLFNRHFLEIALERELQRATRSGEPLAVLMIDVDHFKAFNDLFGHEAGDLVLRELAGCLQSTVRAEDIVCRYGGEEFVILLPEITRERAMEAAERLRQRVSMMRLELRGEPLRQISISVGLATYPDLASDAVDLLRMADRALYQAKRAGRNQVHIMAV
ncbi:MAG TPA: GGDEF domain-containing protein [Granulicella sp.]|nr:GGDEF domain-containing protein [Granulicella sp.]